LAVDGIAGPRTLARLGLTFDYFKGDVRVNGNVRVERDFAVGTNVQVEGDVQVEGEVRVKRYLTAYDVFVRSPSGTGNVNLVGLTVIVESHSDDIRDLKERVRRLEAGH
jgi:cytoskeletal protein CcmA (bactofilin family)